jgi:hypothetical protein
MKSVRASEKDALTCNVAIPDHLPESGVGQHEAMFRPFQKGKNPGRLDETCVQAANLTVGLNRLPAVTSSCRHRFLVTKSC